MNGKPETTKYAGFSSPELLRRARVLRGMAERYTRDDEACMSEHFQPKTFGCHEALHMASVLAEMVDERLCQHPAIQLNPDWRSKADFARSVLFDLYQSIGAEHL